jgi:DNA-directed RNA polymerase subunit RPC12/RpoP
MKEKGCSRCKLVKPLSEFNKGKDTKSGYQSACRECERIATKSYRKYRTFDCQLCGVEFKRRTDYKKSDNKHCAKCSNKVQGEKRRGKKLEKLRTGEYVTCDNCGKKHYKRQSQLKRNFSHTFCSGSCRGKWSAKHHVPDKFISSADNSGSRNGRYKHGNRVGGHDRHKKLRERIVKRDGNGCLICKSQNKIHVHRIIPGGLGGKYTIENTVILCSTHHAEVHRDYESWKLKLLQMIGGSTA